MIAHVATVDGTADQVDRFISRVNTDVAPMIQTRKGFIESIALVDRDAGRGLLVTLWESRMAAAASDEQSKREGATQGVSASVGLHRTAQWYEVAAMTKAAG